MVGEMDGGELEGNGGWLGKIRGGIGWLLNSRKGWMFNCDGQVFAAVWMAGALTERNVPDKICKFGISVIRIAKG